MTLPTFFSPRPSAFCFSFVSLVCVAVSANPSFAQTTPSGAPASSSSGASARANASAGGDKSADTAARSASVHFERGVELFRDGDYKLAQVEFERSYELVPDYRFLYNLGQVYFQLGNFAQAQKTLRQYLEQGGAKVDAARRDQVTKDLESLKIRVAFLGVTSNVAGARVVIDGETVATTPLSDKLVVNGGTHHVQVAKDGYVTSSIDVTLAGTETSSVDLHLSVEPPRDSGSHIDPVVVVGWSITGALAVVTVVEGVSWSSASSDLTAAKSGRTTSTTLQNDADSVTARRNITYVLGGAAIVAAGVSLYLTLARSGHSDSAPKHESAFSLTPFGAVGVF